MKGYCKECGREIDEVEYMENKYYGRGLPLAKDWIEEQADGKQQQKEWREREKMRIKECKEWDKLPIEIREILLENQKLLNKYLVELEDDKLVRHSTGSIPLRSGEVDSADNTNSKFSKSKEKAGVKKDANIE